MRAAKKFAKPCYPGMRVRGGGSPLRIAEEEISFHRRTPTLGEIEFIRNHGL